MKHEKRVYSRRLVTYRTTATSGFFHPQSHTRGSVGSFHLPKKNPRWFWGLGKLLKWPEVTAGTSSEFPTGPNPLLKVAQCKSTQTKEPAKYNCSQPRNVVRL